MKVLLITPLSHKTNVRWTPVGLAYIASNLKKHGHEVLLFDRYLQNVVLKNQTKVNENMKLVIQNYKPDIIGFSTFSPIIHDTISTIRYVRGYYDDIIVAGGHHVTAMPKLTLERIPGLDYIIAGEGEMPLTDLANGKPVKTIPGIFTRFSNASLFENSQTSDLNKLPQPAYSIFDMNYYTKECFGSIRGFYLKTADIVSSRGCNNNCVFCSESMTFGKGVRRHSSDYVMETIENLITNYDINGLYFHDNDFLIYRDHAENICRELIKSGIHKKLKWAVQSGTNRIDNDILKLMAEAGCVKIEFGMESVSPDHLKGIRKNRSVEMSENVIKLCRDNNIKVHSYFMTGFENETIDDLNALIEWIRHHKPHTFQLGLVKIYPGTQLYETNGNSFFENNSWTEYNLNKYFRTDFFSDIPVETRISWNNEIYNPFRKKYAKKELIKTSSINTLLKFAKTKLNED